MNSKKIFFIILLLFFCVIFKLSIDNSRAQTLNEWEYTSPFNPENNVVVSEGQFNGYLSYWTNEHWKWIRYGNLFQINIPNAENYIMQNKLDIAEELGLTGLWMEEGFLYGLITEPYITLENPSLEEVVESSKNKNLLIYIDASSSLGKELESKLPSMDNWKNLLKSNQFYGEEYKGMNAFYLENKKSKLFVVSSRYADRINNVKELIENLKRVLETYDLHRGWSGVGTDFYSVTCDYGHPLEVIGIAMNQGNDWILFAEPKLQNDLKDWLGRVNLSFVADVGGGSGYGSSGTVMYGCSNYNGLKTQDNRQKIEDVIKFTREQGGYIFRSVYQDELDKYKFDGYIGSLGNKEQIDNEDVPFIIYSGNVRDRIPNCMILFVDKGMKFTKDLMYKAIFGRRNVAVMEQGRMMGPKIYRNALQMLVLDRIFLEEYFGDRIQINPNVENQELIVNIENTSPKSVSGTLEIITPAELAIKGSPTVKVILPPKTNKTITFSISPSLASMKKDNPIAVRFNWEGKKKETLTVMRMPPAISIHKLLYGNEPNVSFPVTIHNFTDSKNFNVKVQVYKKSEPDKIIQESSKDLNAEPGEFQTVAFSLNVPAGNYDVKVSALGGVNIGQLGVGRKSGKPRLLEIDLNGDGINEYRMENDKVMVTLLRTGARVIEYIVKERNDNLFFKLWPKKEDTERRPFRKREYYPYGGFEDFLGQPSIETHAVFDAETIQKEGDYVRVKMTSDFYGNKIEKIFTLYGDSPLLEVLFALTFKNPEMDLIGPQPMLELGEKHWLEDAFFVPTQKGIEEYRMRPEAYYGDVLYQNEGWNAGFETKENTTFIGAFPVSEPLFVHMFMNHPSNPGSHHYYVEFQPWVPIYRNSVTYFSYYIWGAGGSWKDGLKEIEKMGLLTKK
jgi:hypothetical protein